MYSKISSPTAARSGVRAPTDNIAILLTYFKPIHGLYVDAPPREAREQIARTLRQIERQRGVRSADLSRARLWTVYAWAMGEGLTDVNPVVGVRKIQYDGKRERVLTDDELVRIWRACDAGYFPKGVIPAASFAY
jgi:integrase